MTGVAGDAEKPAVEQKEPRLAGFARFFKSYMSISAVVAASVPVPVAVLRLIPVYAQQRGFLSVYASLFCFLLVAFAFSMRHALAAQIFYRGTLRKTLAMLPAASIAICMGCIAGYHWTLEHSLATWAARGVTASSEAILSKADLTEIPGALPLTLYYLGIFVFAEAAFVLMAMREYLQDLLQLGERQLIASAARRPRRKESPGMK